MSVKTASTDAPILDLLAQRWSPRAFADRSVDAASLRSLFEAARWAASSFGEQPWSFLVAAREDVEEFEKLASVLLPGNAWARKVPVLALSVTALEFARNGKPNRHAYHDVGLAMGNVCTQATAMNLYVHQMAGFDTVKAREIFSIPERHDPVAMIAIGYVGDPNSLPDAQRASEIAPRQRKTVGQFVFRGKWGEPAQL